MKTDNTYVNSEPTNIFQELDNAFKYVFRHHLKLLKSCWTPILLSLALSHVWIIAYNPNIIGSNFQFVLAYFPTVIAFLKIIIVPLMCLYSIEYFVNHSAPEKSPQTIKTFLGNHTLTLGLFFLYIFVTNNFHQWLIVFALNLTTPDLPVGVQLFGYNNNLTYFVSAGVSLLTLYVALKCHYYLLARVVGEKISMQYAIKLTQKISLKLFIGLAILLLFYNFIKAVPSLPDYISNVWFSHPSGFLQRIYGYLSPFFDIYAAFLVCSVGSLISLKYYLQAKKRPQ